MSPSNIYTPSDIPSLSREMSRSPVLTGRSRSPAVFCDTSVDPMPVISEEFQPDSPSTTGPSTLRGRSPSPDASESISRQAFRRRSSRLERWLEAQLSAPSAASAGKGQGTAEADAYLAYPGIYAPRVVGDDADELSSLESFVLVDEDTAGTRSREDLEDVFRAVDISSAPPPARSSPALSPVPATPPRPYSALSLRKFRLSLSLARASSASLCDPASPTASRFRRPDTSMGHSRGFSASLAPDQAFSQEGPSTPWTSRSGWKFRRPAVLGAFSSPQPSTSASSSSPEPASSSDMLNIARPSFSSSRTFSSGTTGTSTDLSPPHKRTRTPSRSSSATPFKSSSPSLWSLPLHASHMNDPPGSETMLASEKQGSIRIPFKLKTPVSTSPTIRHVPSMLPLPGNKRKKKLVISGISMHDNHRVQNVRRWCESFGEVHQITRAKNGDLHVEFRKAEVADTVCRLNARVYIADVGSVILSWYTGKKP